MFTYVHIYRTLHINLSLFDIHRKASDSTLRINCWKNCDTLIILNEFQTEFSLKKYNQSDIKLTSPTLNGRQYISRPMVEFKVRHGVCAMNKYQPVCGSYILRH
jgi:hypothetical protein